MRWQYKLAFFLILLSQTSFMIFAIYNMDSQTIINEQTEEQYVLSYSWIWYHPEQYIVSLILAVFSLIMFLYGVTVEKIGNVNKDNSKHYDKDYKSFIDNWGYIIGLAIVWIIIILGIYLSGFLN